MTLVWTRLLMGVPLLLWGHRVPEYRCDATSKLDWDQPWPADRLAKGQWHLLVKELGEKAFVSRCSFAPSKQEITCDEYKVDRVEFDTNVKLKKYYVFSSQYDLQIFQDLTFIENNGRGGLMFGKCRLTAP